MDSSSVERSVDSWSWGVKRLEPELAAANVGYVVHHLMPFCAQSREKKYVRVQADDPVSFLQLTSQNDLGTTEVSSLTRQLTLCHIVHWRSSVRDSYENIDYQPCIFFSMIIG